MHSPRFVVAGSNPGESQSTEKLIRLADVPKVPWLPQRSDGKRLNISTVFRWAQRGLRGVRLGTTQAGGTKCTTEADLRQFFADLSAASGKASADRTRRQRQHAIEQAERELNAAGI